MGKESRALQLLAVGHSLRADAAPAVVNGSEFRMMAKSIEYIGQAGRGSPKRPKSIEQLRDGLSDDVLSCLLRMDHARVTSLGATIWQQ